MLEEFFIHNITRNSETRHYYSEVLNRYVTFEDISNLVKENRNIVVTEDDLGLDVTRETLIRVAFEGKMPVPKNERGREDLMWITDTMGDYISTEVFKDMIKAGGVEEFYRKKGRERNKKLDSDKIERFKEMSP